MDFPESMALRHPIYVWDGDEKVLLPDWAKAAFWLGWWCRRLPLEHQRLLVVAVLPARTTVAAFVGLGCLIAGATQFRGGLTWNEFRNFPPGTEVFWKLISRKGRYGGVVLKTNACYPNMVQLKITKGDKRRVGTTWWIADRTFNEHLFSEESLPTARGNDAMENAMRFHRSLGVVSNPRWIWTAGAEVCIVTNQTRFRVALSGLKIGANGADPVPFEDALCAPRGSEMAMAKLRVVSAHHASGKEAPVTILDGESTFHQIHQIESGNILMLVERSGYTTEIHNYLLDARSVAVAPPPKALQDFPSRFPPGMELVAFAIPKDQ